MQTQGCMTPSPRHSEQEAGAGGATGGFPGQSSPSRYSFNSTCLATGIGLSIPARPVPWPLCYLSSPWTRTSYQNWKKCADLVPDRVPPVGKEHRYNSCPRSVISPHPQLTLDPMPLQITCSLSHSRQVSPGGKLLTGLPEERGIWGPASEQFSLLLDL